MSVDTGSPACAGIDHQRSYGGGTFYGLPRVRGDRPYEAGIRTPPLPAPPRARGSTPAQVGAVAIGRGSPACAGIDPLPPSKLPSASRLPRVRGDRPKRRKAARQAA